LGKQGGAPAFASADCPGQLPGPRGGNQDVLALRRCPRPWQDSGAMDQAWVCAAIVDPIAEAGREATVPCAVWRGRVEYARTITLSAMSATPHAANQSGSGASRTTSESDDASFNADVDRKSTRL